MSHYVYRYFNCDGRLLYIGCSKDPWTRYRSHRQDSRLWIDEVARGKISVFPSQAEALSAEKAAIIAEKPIYNRQFRWDYRDGWTQQDYIDYTLGFLRTSYDPRRAWSGPHLTAVRIAYRAMFGETLAVKPRHLRSVG